MNIAVIGTGTIGTIVGKAAANTGHGVQFGSRARRGIIEIDGTEMNVGSVPDALAAADVVVVAVPSDTVEQFAREHGLALGGKVVIDTTNQKRPVGEHAEPGSFAFADGRLHSLSTFAEHAPNARYARAFNTLGWKGLARPDFEGVAADLFFSCAEDDRPLVEELIDAAGLVPIFVGEEQYDLLDGVLRLWFALTHGHGRDGRLAFKVIR